MTDELEIEPVEEPADQPSESQPSAEFNLHKEDNINPHGEILIQKKIGINNTNPQEDLDLDDSSKIAFGGTDALSMDTNNLVVEKLLKLTSADADPTGGTGSLHYNTTDTRFNGYNGAAWKSLAWYTDVPDVSPYMTFGGDGSDGAWDGDGTIDLGSAAFVVKNYSSINIEAGDTMSFSNPHANGTVVVIRCSGNATIADTISLGNDSTGGQTGAAGGVGGAGNSDAGIAGATGTNGNDPTGEWDSENNHYGSGGTGFINEQGAGGGGGGQVVAGGDGTTTGNATLGAGGAKQLNWTGLFNLNHQRKTYFATCGAGGAGGGGGSGAYGGTVGGGGDGGRGGGALILEVAGNLNVTGGTIEAEGFNGEDGDSGGNCGASFFPRPGAGGGGGAGGTVIILYKGTLTGTLTPSVVGGTGGAGGVGGLNCATTAGAGGNGSAGSYIFEQYKW